MTMDELKMRIDVGKMMLNHLILVIMGVGAGSISMLKSKDYDFLMFSGIILTVFLFAIYMKSISKMGKYLDNIKDIKEED